MAPESSAERRVEGAGADQERHVTRAWRGEENVNNKITKIK